MRDSCRRLSLVVQKHHILASIRSKSDFAPRKRQKLDEIWKNQKFLIFPFRCFVRLLHSYCISIWWVHNNLIARMRIWFYVYFPLFNFIHVIFFVFRQNGSVAPEISAVSPLKIFYTYYLNKRENWDKNSWEELIKILNCSKFRNETILLGTLPTHSFLHESTKYVSNLTYLDVVWKIDESKLGLVSSFETLGAKLPVPLKNKSCLLIKLSVFAFNL